MAERKSRWLIVTPTGDQLVFDSLTELQDAVMGGEGEEPMRVSSCDLEPSTAFAAAQKQIVAGRSASANSSPRETTLAGIPLPGHVTNAVSAGRTTNVGGFSTQPKATASASALLRQTPVPPSGARGRGRPRHVTPAGVFALPANPRMPTTAANDGQPAGGSIGPSGTVPGMISPLSNSTSPGLPPAPEPIAARRDAARGHREAAARGAPPGTAELRRGPRFSSISPTCPGLYPLGSRTSPGLQHPGQLPPSVAPVIPPANRYTPSGDRYEGMRGLPPVAVVQSIPVAAAPVAARAAPLQGPARATPSPSGEPSLDSVDAMWAAMLQSTSKFVLPVPKRASPSPGYESGAPGAGAGAGRGTPPMADPVFDAQSVDEAWESVAAGIPVPPQMPENVGPRIDYFAEGNERALLAQAREIAVPVPVPPVPSNWVPAEVPPALYTEMPEMPPLPYPLPEPPAFVAFDGGAFDPNAVAMPPPSLPIRDRTHEQGPDLSEAMREQSPRLATPRYSIPAYDDDRDTPSSASMQLMQPERRFPRWWFPLIAAAGFGVGVLIVVGREGPPAATHAEVTAQKGAPASESKTPSAGATNATGATGAAATGERTREPVVVTEREPAPVAAPPLVPAPIAPAPIATSAPAAANERREEPKTVNASTSARATEASAERAAAKSERAANAANATDGAAPAEKPVREEGKTNYERAVNAQRAGDSARARTLFKTVSDKEPHNFEAQTGLGDAERAQGDKAAAILAYRRALAENPSFYPALLGLADTLWDSGDHTAAAERYAEVARRFSPSMYPNRVRERVSADTEAPAP